MTAIRQVCVYCGSSEGRSPHYGQAARELAGVLVAREIGLVYGGGGIGLMGILADAVMEQGGSAIGIIPHDLAAKELAHHGLTRLEVVASMHARKARMAELSDAFVALPGGLGTLEEILEIATWSQLGLHGKPCGVLNVGGYFDGLIGLLDHAVTEGFLREIHRHMILVADRPDVLLDAFARYQPEPVPKWIDREGT